MLGLAARVTVTSKNSPRLGGVTGTRLLRDARSEDNSCSVWSGLLMAADMGTVEALSGMNSGASAETVEVDAGGGGAGATGVSFSSKVMFRLTSSSVEVSWRTREMSLSTRE